MEPTQQLILARDLLPVLAECDLLVAGGSFGGAAAALAAAEAGQRVVLVEQRTYLGREVTAQLRLFAAVPSGKEVPSLVQSCLGASSVSLPGQSLIGFKLGELKTHLEDRLLNAGVKIIYASLPVGLVTGAGRMAGIVIGNKSGRQVIRASTVIDATETGLLFRLAGADAPAYQTRAQGDASLEALFFRTLEFNHVGPEFATLNFAPNSVASAEVSDAAVAVLPVPEELGIAGNRVRLAPGALGEEHWFVECPLSMPVSAKDAFALTSREIAARSRTMALAAYLLEHVRGFEKAVLAGASQLLSGPFPPFLEGEFEEQFLHTQTAHIPFEKLGGPLAGLFRLPGSFELSPADRDGEILAACAAGEALGSWLASRPGEVERAEPPRAAAPSEWKQPAGNLQVMEPDSPQRGRAYPRQAVSPMPVPILREVDVLVIGGGTSGATAAFAAANSGVKTVLVEASPGLGGTGTMGGVHSYWFGRRVGFSRQVIDAVEAMHAELGLEPPQGGLLKWNIEAKMHALLRRAQDAGVEMLWGAVAIGAVVEDKRVRGVVVATPLGPAAVLAKVVIDATGDGDIAYFAGAPVVYGAARDHITMWYSLAQFYRPGMTRNNFTSMVDVGNVEDVSRAILAGRRRAQGYDAGTYVAPRESRHVLADVVLTLTDQLLKRAWADVITIAFSNHDIKGHSSSDWLRVGLIPPNLEVEIPYRALLPQGLEGILMTGKAISATHDALPAIRMQPDIENLGGAAGTAAALAVQTGRSPREVDVRVLQRSLAGAGVLPGSILERSLQPHTYTREELGALAEQVIAAKPLNRYQDMELDEVFVGRIPFVDLCCVGPGAVEVLKSALDQHGGQERVILAKALALLGSKDGVAELIAALHRATPDEGLQVLQERIRHMTMPPDQGAMPEAANLLYALGMARDERVLPVWDHFSSIIAETKDLDIRDRSLGLFYYVDAICFGAERLGSPRAVPFLKRLRARADFQNQSTSAGIEPDIFLERQAYLELVIARALARCGDREGYEVLVRYLSDARALLAEHAHTELRAITGQDFGKDGIRWREWMSGSDGWKRPHPILEPNEPLQAWQETFLRE